MLFARRKEGRGCGVGRKGKWRECTSLVLWEGAAVLVVAVSLWLEVLHKGKDGAPFHASGLQETALGRAAQLKLKNCTLLGEFHGIFKGFGPTLCTWAPAGLLHGQTSGRCPQIVWAESAACAGCPLRARWQRVRGTAVWETPARGKRRRELRLTQVRACEQGPWLKCCKQLCLKAPRSRVICGTTYHWGFSQPKRVAGQSFLG